MEEGLSPWDPYPHGKPGRGSWFSTLEQLSSGCYSYLGGVPVDRKPPCKNMPLKNLLKSYKHCVYRFPPLSQFTDSCGNQWQALGSLYAHTVLCIQNYPRKQVLSPCEIRKMSCLGYLHQLVNTQLNITNCCWVCVFILSRLLSLYLN